MKKAATKFSTAILIFSLTTAWLFSGFPQIQIGSFEFPHQAQQAEAASWYSSSWSSRVALTIDYTKVGATLTNFPVYVNLANLSSDFWNKTISGCGDIRVTQGDGTTEVPREVVTCNAANQTGELWFKADSLSNSVNTTFYIYYGNAGASDYATNATYGAQNVWDSNYKAVYHLNEAVNNTAGGYKDSTSNALNGTGTSMALAATSSVFSGAKAQDFDGSADYINATIPTTATNNWTISAWANPRVASQDSMIVYNGAGATNGYGFAISNGAGGSGNVLTGLLGGVAWFNSNASAVSGTTWYDFVMVRDSGTTKFYQNGAVQSGTNASAPNTPTGNLQIGREVNNAAYFNGAIDEVRVSDIVRASTWISTEYNNQNSPSTFYSVASGESSTVVRTLRLFGNLAASAGVTTFTASGTYTVPAGVRSVDVLVVAGGGGGGGTAVGAGTIGGGGGAGGLIFRSGYTVTPGASLTVTVGAGGSGGAAAFNSNGIAGGNSVFDTITATGGGYGGGAHSSQAGNAGGNGGSGGGGGGSTTNTAGGTGTAGQGNNGSDDQGGGGGGGGGGAGAAAGPSSPTGAVGATYFSTTYAAGGSANGSWGSTVTPPAKGANTGNGGDGGWGAAGGAGGSGIVIVAVPLRSLRVIGARSTPDARTAKTVTPAGNAQIDTAQSKFGGASGLFDGTGDSVSAASTADCGFGTGDFTVDFWVRFNSISSASQALFTLGTNPYIHGFSVYTQKMLWWRNGSGDFYGTSTINSGTWYHMAYTRASGVGRLFLNGTKEGADRTDTFNYGASSGCWVAQFADAGTQFFNGWIDELRVSKGIARWTSDFTPPTSAYTHDQYTKLLLHMDGADASTAFTDTAQDTTPNRQVIVYAQPTTAVSDAPTGLVATPDDAQVSLSWTAPSGNGHAVTGYKIYRDTTSNPTTLVHTNDTTTAWTDTGLTNGTTYYYRVTAVNVNGESAYSSEVSAIPALIFSAAYVASSGRTAGAVDYDTSHDFTDVPFGAEPTGSNTRWLVATVHNLAANATAGTITGVTIGGIAATSVIAPTSAGTQVAIFIANVPTGTSDTVTINSSTAGYKSMGLYQLINPPSSTPTATNSATGTGDPFTISVNISAGQFAIAVAGKHTGDTDSTWTGLTETYDISTNGGVNMQTAASGSTPGTPRAITVSIAAGYNGGAGAVAVWGP